MLCVRFPTTETKSHRDGREPTEKYEPKLSVIHLYLRIVLTLIHQTLSSKWFLLCRRRCRRPSYLVPIPNPITCQTGQRYFKLQLRVYVQDTDTHGHGISASQHL